MYAVIQEGSVDFAFTNSVFRVQGFFQHRVAQRNESHSPVLLQKGKKIIIRQIMLLYFVVLFLKKIYDVQ